MKGANGFIKLLKYFTVIKIFEGKDLWYNFFLISFYVSTINNK